MSIEELAEDMKIADGPSEYYKPRNVGLLFFNDNPEDFFLIAELRLYTYQMKPVRGWRREYLAVQ